MARKHIIFWGLILILLSITLIYTLPSINPPVSLLTEEQKSSEEIFAEVLEIRYAEIDVLNIRNFINENEDFTLALYFDVISPLSSSKLETVLLDMLQGLDELADGTEDIYSIEYLYGHWRVGHTVCPARYIPDVQTGLEVCQYIEIYPPEYFGGIILWEGR